MKRTVFSRCLSVFLTLCIVLSCITVSFVSVGAVTVEENSSVSASSETNKDFSWDNATVYFLLTDRFKNGNTSNDHSYNRGLNQSGAVVSNIDDRATFHGGDFAGITQTIKDGYFNDLGVNAIWISAPYEQIHGYVVGDDSNPSYAHYSYHGYYVLDYTQTDANFGTAKEFETLVDTAHEHGLRVILDVVLNHAGYNSMHDMGEYGFGTLKSGWQNTYYTHQGINNSTYHSFIDYDSSASDWGKWWGTDWIRCGVAGYSEQGGSDLTNTLSGLPDFRTESSKTVDIPAILKTKWTKEGRLSQETNELKSYLSSKGKTQTVTNSISYWLSTWVREYGVDGFRCDTAKHVEQASWKTLKTTCVEALKEWRKNNPNKPGANWDEEFWMTGECWDHNIGWGKDAYFTQGGFDSMINFETQGGGLVAQGSVKNVYNGYASSINTQEGFNQLSYLSSHDSTLTRGNLIQTGSAFLLLPGGVQIFYGDETNRPYVSGIGNDGNGGAGHSLRSDMNWSSMDKNVLAHWQKVGTFRNNHIAVGAGSNTDLSTTAGYAFGREYNKNGMTDKVAGCIYAGSNTNVTIDVSKLWKDGQNLMNAYDQSSAVVSGGKVTFNSGANGTILIQEPDGRPLMNVTGAAKFTGTQTVTVSLEECEVAKCSIDGGNKFYVYDGTTFSIGSTGYDGDTITVTLEAENDKGSSKADFTFEKAKQGEVIDPTPTQPVEKAKILVSTHDGSAPYAYVWVGADTALAGAWPGTKLTQRDSEGNYVLELNTTETYNVVLNNGSGAQSADLTNLNGTSKLKVNNSSYSSSVISTGTPINGGDENGKGVTIHVKPYNSGSAPYLYVWTDNDGDLNGAWPGGKLTSKDEDGNYVFTVPGKSSVNAIVNNGSGGQTADITGLSGEVLITVTDAGCTQYKLTKLETPASGVELLKSMARKVKAMTESDYTASSWASLKSLMTSVDTLVVQGEDADEATVQSTITKLESAMKALVLNNAKLTYAVSGNSTIKGVAASNANVSVVVGGKTYNVVSDDVTGAFTVTGATVNASSTIKVTVTRNGVSSASYTYNMSSGNINNGETPTSPTTPTDPQPTDPQPTDPKPTDPQPTDPQPTDSKPTDPTPTVPDDSDNTLTIKATSNIFPSATQTVDVEQGTVTLTYKLDSTMDVVNAQWKLTYDSSKLACTAEGNKDAKGQTITPVVGSQLVYKFGNGYVNGNFTNLNMYTFDGDNFVSVTFDIIGSGTANVNLNLEILTVGYFDDNFITVDKEIVDFSRLMDISNVKGFENASITTKTEFASTGLVVNASSNIFPVASQKFDPETGTVTVTYKLDSTMDVVNTQWKLTYDSDKLEYSASNNAKTITPVVGSQLVYKVNDGVINGNFTNLNMFTFDDDAFVSVTFDVIGSGKANVYLDVEILTVGYFDDNFITIDKEIVDFSKLIDLSGVKGFENAKLTTETVVEAKDGILLGDVNGDGYVTINDVTDILKATVNLKELSSNQEKAADVDFDGVVSVKDATQIQKYLAGLIKEF